MITTEQAAQLRRPSSLLERLLGVSPRGKELSPTDLKALEFVNRIPSDLVADTFLYLDRVAAIPSDEVPFNQPGLQEEIGLLQQHGVNPHDNGSMTFVYSLLGERLHDLDRPNDRQRGLHTLIQLKRIANSETLEVAQQSHFTTGALQDFIDQEVRKVETYLASYLTAIMPVLLEEYLPLEITVPGLDQDHNFALELNPKNDFLMPGSFGYEYDFIIKPETPLWRERYPNIAFVNLNEIPPGVLENSYVTVDEDCHVIRNMTSNHLQIFIGGRSPLRTGIYGSTVPFPLPLGPKTYTVKPTLDLVNTEFSFLGIGYRRRREADLRRLAEIFNQGEGELEQPFTQYFGDTDQHAFWSIDIIVLRGNLRNATKLRYKKEDTKIRIEYDKFRGKTIDWDKVTNNPAPAFVFKYFSPEKYRVRDAAQFWDTLHAYANLPAALTERMTDDFTRTFVDIPTVDLEEKRRLVYGYLQMLQGTLASIDPETRLIED